MTVKSIVKSFLQKTGYDLVRFSPELNRPFPVLPMLVSEKLKRGEPFYFVQVGANDGVLDDPLRELIYQHHFPGLLIEPLPDLFERLKTNYAGEHQLVYENVAILDREGPVEIHRIRSDADVPGHWHGIASFHRKNLLAQGVPPQFIEAQSVHGVPLHVLLARHGIDRISLLQIDTEGYDYEVIRAAIESSIYPDMINYEHCWLEPHTRLACKKLLDQNGYQFIEVGKDTLAVRLPQ
jgi:FkbM family methyltransferase